MAEYTCNGGRGSKRIAQVPMAADVVGTFASKADLLEVLWDLVACSCESADDEMVVAGKLIELIEATRARNNAPKFRLPRPKGLSHSSYHQAFDQALASLRRLRDAR